MARKKRINATIARSKKTLPQRNGDKEHINQIIKYAEKEINLDRKKTLVIASGIAKTEKEREIALYHVCEAIQYLKG